MTATTKHLQPVQYSNLTIPPPRFLFVLFQIVASGCVAPLGEAPAGTDSGTKSPEAATDTADSTLSPTDTPTAELVSFPDGPKERPLPPKTLTKASVREYVHTMEYRYVSNSLWRGQYTDVHVSCEVEELEQRDYGYSAVVACTGYSNVNPPENSTASPGVHYDYFTQVYRYVVTEDETRRRFVEER